jgi:superfamily II DNA or RNA helicase
LWDPRVRRYRAPAFRYPDVLSALRARGVRVVDEVTRSPPLDGAGQWTPVELRPYQQAALTAWELSGRRGIISLPTGSGKTRVAIAALATLTDADGEGVHRPARPALCLVPTRVLLHQWRAELGRFYQGRIGCFGDGEHTIEAITVCTFESAYRYAARFGSLFDLVIVDEVHHFGARLRDEALEMCVAPLRLGLTATLPADALQMSRLVELVGPVVHLTRIEDLAGTYLSPFEVVVIRAALEAQERARYMAEYVVFRDYRHAFLRLSPEASWADFVRAASRSEEGRRALAAWRKANRLIAFPQSKRRLVGELLARHRDCRILVFTANNETAYAIAREHLVMPLTCDIRRREREAVLARFRRGDLRVLVSARVLNEGLDVPDAEVAIVVGGTLGEREHVQRVGRLLRPAPGKRATVYELVVTGTSEAWSGRKRRRSLGSYVVHSG